MHHVATVNSFYNTDTNNDSYYLLAKEYRVRLKEVALVIAITIAVIIYQGMKYTNLDILSCFVILKLVNSATHITVNRAKLKGIANYICPLFLRKKFYQISLFGIKFTLPQSYKK